MESFKVEGFGETMRFVFCLSVSLVLVPCLASVYHDSYVNDAHAAGVL